MDTSSAHDSNIPNHAVDELDFRLRFLSMSAADAEVLRSLLPMFRRDEEQFVKEFYDHLRSFPSTAQYLQDPERFERLQRLQQNHFRTLLEAKWDDEFVQTRRKVGDVHATVGIEPQFFLGAYFVYIQHCLRRIFESRLEAGNDACEVGLSLVKAVFLDIGLTLDAYFRQSTQKVHDALDMLWKANQDLRQFAQLTTHDLKTPLATVSNLCEEALDEFGAELPAEARKLIESARHRIFRMSAMIDELLAATVTPYTSESDRRTDLNHALHEVVERLRPTIKQKGIVLTLPPHCPAVAGNPIRLREAIYNVLSNAVKFVPSQTGRIEVQTESVDSRVRMSVIDNGPGIARDELHGIFAPFRRLSNTADQAGSGLGLYFAKNLVESAGGRIWAESEPGRGSVFHIELAAEGTAAEPLK